MYDVVVIGGGPAGVAAAIRVAQLGGKVCIVEKDKLGGVCTHWGCIPTKAMIASAKIAAHATTAKALGVSYIPRIAFSQVIEHRNKAIKASHDHIQRLLDEYEIPVFYGMGSIYDDNTVIVHHTPIKTKKIILSTGSRPCIPPGMQLSKKVLTSKQLVDIQNLPSQLVVIGGGVIGLEFATMFHYLGSKVTVVELNDQLLPGMDSQISQALYDKLVAEGITVYVSTKVEGITRNKVLTEEGDFYYDKVLVATGREPAIDVEALDATQIKHNYKHILVNNKMQTSRNHIYAIGDATGQSILAHVGIQQGIVAAENCMNKKATMEYTVPLCIFTIPEIAAVGKQKHEVKNGKEFLFPLRQSSKAIIEGETFGFVKVVMQGKKIVGFHMIGKGVTELINEATLIVNNSLSVEKVISTIHPHPTLGEVIKYVVEKSVGRCTEDVTE